MPRYFFHVIDGKFLKDDIGHECADIAEARKMAVEFAGGMIRDLKPDEHSGEWQMHICDESGDIILKVKFSIEPVSGFPRPRLASSR